MTRPHSDNSKRAQGRKATRDLKRAQSTVEHSKKVIQATTGQGPVPQAPPGSGGGIPVDIKDLMARIGTMTVQVDYWKEQAQTYAVALGKMQAKWAGQPDPEGYVDPDEVPADVSTPDLREAEEGQRPDEQAEEQATGKSGE